MTAMRLARAATGRDRIIKFAGAYHGHVDGLLAQAGSGLATQGIPASPGVPAAAAADDGRRALERPRAPCAQPWPSTSSRRSSPSRSRPTWASSRPSAGFLELLRERADASGALLILDEVISGFRVARGGAQEPPGWPPTWSCSARSSAAACRRRPSAGRASCIERLAPAGEVYQAGTLSGNPLAVAAGLATLALARRRRRTSPGARSPSSSPTGCATRAPAHASGGVGARAADRVLQRAAACATSPTPRRCDLEAYGAWCRELLARGVYPPPSQFEAWFPSLAHGPEQIELTLEAAAAAFATCRRGPRGPCEQRARGPRARCASRAGCIGAACSRPGRRRQRCEPRRARRRGPASRERARRVRASDRGDLRGLPAPLRPGSRSCSPTTPTSRCSPATASTRSASNVSSRSATSTPCASSPT